MPPANGISTGVVPLGAPIPYNICIPVQQHPLSRPPSPHAARWSSPVGVIRLEGPGSRRFLHGQSSQAIELAAEGACLATCLISPTARMRALALVRVEANATELVVLAGDAQAVHQALDRVLFPADGVRLEPVQPAQLVRDAQAHGVEVRPVDVMASDWDCTLEPVPGRRLRAVRLGLRQVRGHQARDGVH